jgi:hypothetical protein
MSAEHPNILYVGQPEAGRGLLEAVDPEGWYLCRAGELMAALALYITYMPDITVIDMVSSPVLAEAAYYHLRSVDAKPILLLTDDLSLKENGVYTLPAQTDPRDLMTVIQELVGSGQPIIDY